MFQAPSSLAVIDQGRDQVTVRWSIFGSLHSGAMVGAKNMASQLGGVLGSLVFGFLVARTGSYHAGFVPMAALLLLGAGLWLRIDPTRPLAPAAAPATLAASLTRQAE